MPITPPTRPLLRVLGLGFGLAVVVGGVVGQGIMRTPGLVAGALPAAELIIAAWLFGGALVLIDACATVELGASLPRSGGPYVFAKRAFGPWIGQTVGWADWVYLLVAQAYVAVVFAEFLQRLGVELAIGLLATTLLMAVFVINWPSTRLSGASQVVGTSAKGIGLVMLVVILLLAPASAPSPGPVASTATLAGLAVALRAIKITYGGWNSGVYFGDELQQPERNIVRSTFGGILLVTVLYVALNAAVLRVLTPAEMAGSTLVVADAIARVLGASSGLVVTGLALISVAAIANLGAMKMSRTGFALARDGVLPPWVARVSASGTPRRALALGTAASMALALSGGYETLIAVAASIAVLTDASLNVAAIRLRQREPELDRPFKMPLYPLPALLGLAANLLLLAALLYEDPRHSGLGVAFVAAVALIGWVRTWRRAAPALGDIKA